jgi:hypothetical protein
MFVIGSGGLGIAGLWVPVGIGSAGQCKGLTFFVQGGTLDKQGRAIS